MKYLKLTKLVEEELSIKQLKQIKGGGCWGDCNSGTNEQGVGCSVHDGGFKRSYRRDVRHPCKYK